MTNFQPSVGESSKKCGRPWRVREVELVVPYASGCLALAPTEVDLRGCCRKRRFGMTNVTGAGTA